MKKVYIIVSLYEQATDNMGGHMTNFDIHGVFESDEEARKAVLESSTAGPSRPEWKRRFSIVERPLN